MGWEDAHLHEFVIRDERYGVPNEEDVGPRKARDERRFKLRNVVSGERSQFAYNYDFGDYWQHVLTVEEILAPQEGATYPVCLAGARACPPEDVGGVPGYEDFLEAIKDSTHAEHQEFLQWIGGRFDPEAFDVDEVNRRLRGIR